MEYWKRKKQTSVLELSGICEYWTTLCKKCCLKWFLVYIQEKRNDNKTVFAYGNAYHNERRSDIIAVKTLSKQQKQSVQLSQEFFSRIFRS